MPNSKIQNPSSTVSSAKLERKSRLSLPEKDKSNNVKTAGRRNTISEDTVPKTRKKSKAPLSPTIPEDEDEVALSHPEFAVENETRNNSKVNRNTSSASRTSSVSTRTVKPVFTYENGAYEGNIKATSSANNSRPSSRAPSVQSLEIYREQYCCCAKRTKCEKYLLVAVTVLLIIVVVLVIVIVALARNGKLDDMVFKFKL